MELNIKDVITLDDQDEYVVVSKTSYEGKTYCYLSNISDKKELKVCLQEDTTLTDVADVELIEILFNLFLESTNSNYEKENE